MVRGTGRSLESQVWVLARLTIGFPTTLVIADPGKQIPNRVITAYLGSDKENLIFHARKA